MGEENEKELTAPSGLSAFKALGKFSYKAMDITPLKEFAVRNLTYGHDDKNGINNVSFTLRPGEVLAVAGGVGSGKSTLLNVLMGMVPKDSGEVFWNGTEIKHLREFFVPPNAAYTPQIAKMFSDTLGENLLLGRDAGEEEIREALGEGLCSSYLIVKDFEKSAAFYEALLAMKVTTESDPDDVDEHGL